MKAEMPLLPRAGSVTAITTAIRPTLGTRSRAPPRRTPRARGRPGAPSPPASGGRRGGTPAARRTPGSPARSRVPRSPAPWRGPLSAPRSARNPSHPLQHAIHGASNVHGRLLRGSAGGAPAADREGRPPHAQSLAAEHIGALAREPVLHPRADVPRVGAEVVAAVQLHRGLRPAHDRPREPGGGLRA